MHGEALGGGVVEFDAAIEARSCPYLNQLGEVALAEMRGVYEELDNGNYEALGKIAERLAAAAKQKAASKHEPEAPVQPKTPEEPTPAADKLTVQEWPELDPPIMQGDTAATPAVAIITQAVSAQTKHHLLAAEPEVAAVSGSVQKQNKQDNVTASDDIRADKTAVKRGSSLASLERVSNQAARLDILQKYEAAERSRQLLVNKATIADSATSHLGLDILHADEAPEIPSLPKAITHSDVSPEVPIIDEFADEAEAALLEAPDASPRTHNRAEVIDDDGLAYEIRVAEPEQEPEEVYVGFTEALQMLLVAEALPDTNTGESVESANQEFDDELVEAAVGSEPEPMTVVISKVAERLVGATPEEKEVITPVLQEIVVAIQAVEAVETEPEALEGTEAIMVNLKEKILELFDLLGFEYEPEDVEGFIAVLLRPDFQPQKLSEVKAVQADLEHDGTHEAKRHFTQIVNDSIADVEDEMERLLGKLVFLHSPVFEQRQFAV